MVTGRGNWLAVALLGSLAAGCTSWAQKAWPPYPETAQAGQGALLFKLTSATRMNGFTINSVLLMWPDKIETGPHDWSSSQHFRLIARMVDGRAVLPDDVVLIPFRPGAYSRLIVRFFFNGQEIHYVDIDADKFQVAVAPGKVTVVGRLDLNAALDVTGFSDKGTEFNIASKVRVDDGLEAKTSILREALARPEADSLQWRAALEAARRELVPSR